MSEAKLTCQKILQAEVARWSGTPWERLVMELRDVQEYQVEDESKEYQVEVQLVENTADYVHVMLSVDDGTFWGSIAPLTRGFIKRKDAAQNAVLLSGVTP